ncbi:MAG: Crp/Fnr family transcriptional regulator [Anaeromicrobium sp.]|jgi:CRP-like cAMP-binding protein|uniref:Crp/Fnr family transcriptional regulator n=1 Tax=Anaeromicrobium sp. TaxID=1929132 RepID=UPI0025E20020|nr:Crp/Fnr family transcriptional regulator [Anaeromicrobium sp.]MCT4596075.1 Crp/Fnr family transcriptional regulator [Anaeromicrobium sp.]
MYKKIFDQVIQKKMDTFFINNLAAYGKVETFSKGQIINPSHPDNIYIVLEGELNHAMYSKNGDEIFFYRIIEGNIFGEIDFFDENRAFVVNKALTKGKVSVVSREIVESKLKEHPEMYNYFLTSIIKKYRMIMLELSNLQFNDSLGKLADFFVRLYYTENINSNNNISIIFTHEEIAHRIGLNRITVTNGIRLFKDKNLIDIRDRKIIIKDINGLKKLTNIPIE